jgi:hypothetical protein
MRSGTPSGDTPSSSGPRSERGRLAFLGRALACKLRHAAGKIHEMLMHLLERETEDGEEMPKKPIRDTFPVCWARAASGHAAALPSNVMMSRRLIIRSRLRHG